MKKLYIAITIVIIAGIWYFTQKKLTDKEQIKNQLFGLVALCSKQADEPRRVLAIKNSQLQNKIAESCSVSIDQNLINGNYGPIGLSSTIIKAQMQVGYMNIEIDDYQIDIANDKKTATVEYSIRINGETKKGRKLDDGLDLVSNLKKEDNIWKFSTFEIQKVLEK